MSTREFWVQAAVMLVFVALIYLLKLKKKDGKAALLLSLAVIPATILVEFVCNLVCMSIEGMLVQTVQHADWIPVIMSVNQVLVIGVVLLGCITITKLTQAGKPGYWLGVVIVILAIVSVLYENYEYKNISDFMDRWDVMGKAEYYERTDFINLLDIIHGFLNLIPALLYVAVTCVQGKRKKAKQQTEIKDSVTEN